MKIMTAHDVLTDTLQHSGGTYDRTTGKRVSLDTGFMVGGVFTRIVTSRQALEHGSWVAREIASVANRGNYAPYIGTWVDSDMVYIDLCEIYTDRRHALMAARERGELAIWDNAAGASIPVAY